MMNFGKVRGTSKPDPVVIDELSVWVAEDPVSIDVPDDQGTHTEWEYNLIQYDKDEYIHMMDARNAALEQQVNDTMLALCDVYEMLQ